MQEKKKKTLKEILEERGIDLNEKKVLALENINSMKQKVLSPEWTLPEIAPTSIINLCQAEDQIIKKLEEEIKTKSGNKGNVFSSFKFS